MELGKLFVIATPIGNLQDITLRALEIIKSASAVICEEQREGSTLLKKLGIPPKDLITLNEHNEQEQITQILVRLCKGENLALISDCGTPVFADPGAALIRQVWQAGLQVSPVPGPSSLMAALSILDFKPERFVFAGFLPRVPEQRQAELMKLKALNMTVILMDTPYRLGTLLDEVIKAFGSGQAVTLACDMTLPEEKIFRGRVGEIRKTISGKKAEFILIVQR